MTIPLDAIDPTAHADRWLRSFEHHLDLVPPVMDALVTATIPVAAVSRGGSRFDRPKITGNNDEDNMTAFLRGVDVGADGRIVGAGAAADAEVLWWWVVTFTRAVAANIKPTRPAPALVDRPDADPLTARSVALTTVGWLIDHADQIQQLAVYESDIDEMFQEIRHLRGKYGVHDHPRRPRARCATCGTLSVVVTWVDGPNGSPKPVRAGKCRTCGETYRDAPTPVNESHAASREVRSPECADLLHEQCESVHCGCSCHTSGWSA